MQTLDKFVEKAVIDAWKNPHTGKLTFHAPSSRGSADGTLTFSSRWNYAGTYNDQHNEHAGQLDREDRHEADEFSSERAESWKKMLESFGLTVGRQNGAFEAIARGTFKAEEVADLLNTKGSVISAYDVMDMERRRKGDTRYAGEPEPSYTFNTRRVFEIGNSRGLTDEQILERIKPVYSRQ